jgi:polysaccharide chain length determinant protein (PEP-CTERM system associated)
LDFGGLTMGDIDIRFYLSLLLRRLPVVLAIFVSAAALSVAAAYLISPVYEASARILVEAPSIPTELARSTVPTSAEDQMQIIRQQIDTRDNLLSLADKLDIYGDERSRYSPVEIVDDMRSRTKFEKLELETPNIGTSVYSISFDDQDPVIAASAVNAIVDLVLAKNVQQRTGSAGDTLQFFNQEVTRLGGELSQIESGILKFKNANKDSLPDSLEFRRTQQVSQQERLVMLEREETSLRTRRNNLVQMQESTGQVIGNAPPTLEQQMLQDLNKALSEQLTIYSETSPNIVSIRARIAKLQESIRSRNDPNVVSQKKGISDLDFQLSDIDERLRFITAEKSSISDNLAALIKNIAATPANATTLNAMERNRDNIQSQYNTAVARLAEASTGQQIELRAKGGRFSLVEPATPPADPIRPKRKRIIAMGLAGGIALGIGFIVLMEMVNRTVRRPADLEAMFGSQPLATIPYILADGEAKLPGMRRKFSDMFVRHAATLALATVALHTAVTRLV